LQKGKFLTTSSANERCKLSRYRSRRRTVRTILDGAKGPDAKLELEYRAGFERDHPEGKE